MLEFLQDRVIQFNGKILGFEDMDEFVIKIVEENGPYAYLQSVSDEQIGFLVAVPFAFFKNYMFEIEDGDKNQLGLESPGDAAIVVIVNIKEPFTESTVNLLAPIVINVRTGQGRQIVLPPKSSYSTKEPLFGQMRAVKEELQDANSDA